MRIHKAFTLAEIMIVLTIIGILTAILLPSAINSAPNENVMKFKKGNITFTKVISELVSSGEYFTPGNLAYKPDGTLIDGTHEGDITYFCNAFSNVVNTKKVICSNFMGESLIQEAIGCDYDSKSELTSAGGESISLKDVSDYFCKSYPPNPMEEIVTVDGITYYQTVPGATFGHTKINGEWHGEKFFFRKGNCNGIEQYYWLKVFCMDIDGIGKGEDPFGYGVRLDGKIFYGARAKQWIQKNIQDKE